jgi:hypothetical protein
MRVSPATTIENGEAFPSPLAKGGLRGVDGDTVIARPVPPLGMEISISPTARSDSIPLISGDGVEECLRGKA